MNRLHPASPIRDLPRWWLPMLALAVALLLLAVFVDTLHSAVARGEEARAAQRAAPLTARSTAPGGAFYSSLAPARVLRVADDDGGASQR